MLLLANCWHNHPTREFIKVSCLTLSVMPSMRSSSWNLQMKRRRSAHSNAILTIVATSNSGNALISKTVRPWGTLRSSVNPPRSTAARIVGRQSPLRVFPPARKRVSGDSSTSIHLWPTRQPSTTSWSPGRTTSRSPTTRALGPTVCSLPALCTAAVGRVSRAMQSRARLARISWMMPTRMLKEMTPEQDQDDP
jgi:hypothetical protein